MCFVIAGLLKLAQELLLFVREVDRYFYHRFHEHIPTRVRSENGHTFSAQPKLLSGLRTGWHRDTRPAAVDGRDLGASAQGRRGHGNRHTAIDVGPVALEQPMRGNGNEDVEVTRRSAPKSGLAFSAQPDAGSVLDAGGNSYL